MVGKKSSPSSARRSSPPIKSSVKDKNTTAGVEASSEAISTGSDRAIDFFLKSMSNEEQKATIRQLHEMIRQEAPDLEPTADFLPGTMGYGKYHYHYNSVDRAIGYALD